MNIEDINKIVGDNYIVHFNSSNWGDEFKIMKKDGKAFARAYIYYDDLTTLLIDCLTVDESIRKQGIGLELQIIRETIGIYLNAQYSMLWVKRDDWMYDWYKRRGYIEYHNKNRKDNSVWMRKELNNNINRINN